MRGVSCWPSASACARNRGFCCCGHEVKVLLDANQPALPVYERGDLQFPNCEVLVVDTGVGSAQTISEMVNWADKVFVTLSPTDSVMTTERLLAGAAICERKKTLGYSEVPCGHLAPIWREVLAEFDTLFVAQKTQDLRSCSNVVEVGMDIPLLDHIRALATKAKLGFRENDDWIWYSGGPYHQAGQILECIVRAVHQFRRETFPRLQLVFTRHARDKADPKSLGCYCQATQLAEDLSVPIVENSADHKPGETTAFHRDQIISYVQLLEACSANGVLVTGHGTDGIKAPASWHSFYLVCGEQIKPAH